MTTTSYRDFLIDYCVRFASCYVRSLTSAHVVDIFTARASLTIWRTRLQGNTPVPPIILDLWKHIIIQELSKRSGLPASWEWWLYVWTRELRDLDQRNVNDDMKCRHCNKSRRHSSFVCPCYCQYRNTVAEPDVISTEHKEKRDRYPLPCPNECSQDDIPRCDMEEHKTVCPNEIITPTLCGAKVCRCDILECECFCLQLHHIYQRSKISGQ